MSTIHQTLTLPPKGTALALGPVRVTAKYPADTTTSGKRRRNIMVTDSSGSSKMTLWGGAADIPLIDGTTYIFKGKIGINEYNGTTSISAENVVAESSDGTISTNTGSPGSSGTKRINALELANHMAKFTNHYYQGLLEQGISKELAERCITNAPQFAAQWFFGEKYPDEATEKIEEVDNIPF